MHDGWSWSKKGSVISRKRFEEGGFRDSSVHHLECFHPFVSISLAKQK